MRTSSMFWEWFTRIAVLLFVVCLLALSYVYQKKRGIGVGRRPKAPKGQGAASSAFTRDMTSEAEAGKLDPFSGRDEEIDRVIHIVMRRTKNNPLLLGEPGVGKTAIVEGLARRIAAGEVPEQLKGKRVLSLDLTSIVSETKFRGELEARLSDMTSQLETYEGRAILFIDEIHMLEQIGKAEGSLNISDILKPALARGEVQVIGATTWSEYQEYIKPDAALDRRFQPVLVDEPTVNQAISILKHLRQTYEEYHRVRITDAAIEAAVKLSDEKIRGRYLPDKAIDLMDEASAKVSIEATSEGHRIPMGVMHAASLGDKHTVDTDDIEAVVDQWVIHSKAEAARDARR